MQVMWVIRADTYILYSIYKHYQENHGKVLEDLLTRFDVLKKCKYKLCC